MADKMAKNTGKKLLSAKDRSAVAKKAAKGVDIGKKGKNFDKVVQAATDKGMDTEAAKRIAAAAMYKGIKARKKK